jgi:hypothetical protein
MANENANAVRQKAMLRTSKNPGVFYGLKALFLHLAANKGNPDLTFKNIDGYANASDGTNSNDQVIAAAATTVYAIYLKKGTGSTANYFKVTNHNTTGATNGTQDLGYKITDAAEENLFLFPAGHSLSTGMTISQDTAATGSTCSLLIDTCSGFVIHAT